MLEVNDNILKKMGEQFLDLNFKVDYNTYTDEIITNKHIHVLEGDYQNVGLYKTYFNLRFDEGLCEEGVTIYPKNNIKYLCKVISVRMIYPGYSYILKYIGDANTFIPDEYFNSGQRWCKLEKVEPVTTEKEYNDYFYNNLMAINSQQTEAALRKIIVDDEHSVKHKVLDVDTQQFKSISETEPFQIKLDQEFYEQPPVTTDITNIVLKPSKSFTNIDKEITYLEEYNLELDLELIRIQNRINDLIEEFA